MRKVLYFVEGFTDIRFVAGLSEICDLTMCVPARQYVESGLKSRIDASGIPIRVHEIGGSRWAFQWRSLVWLGRHAHEFDAILSQEMLRGSLNATLVGWLRGVPVLTTLMLPPVEYFRCRRERRLIGAFTAWTGERVIRTLMAINGRLASRCIALGPYLRDIARQYSSRVVPGYYYGVDAAVFRPASDRERMALREKLGLPADRFLILLASRISHEKDPETVLHAAARARAAGLDAVVLNLSGGFEDFLAVARELDLPDPATWILARPAAHPMGELADYYRAADMLAQASLEEGLGLSPLEALACGTPVAATAVGGMALQLDGFARLTPRRNDKAMAEQMLWIARHRDEALAQALKGREMVVLEWSRQRAFESLGRLLDEAGMPAGQKAA